MKQREKQAWRARVSRELVKYVYGSVDATMEFPDKYEEAIFQFGNKLVRDFKAAIRRVR